jgi:hypothetical protein
VQLSTYASKVMPDCFVTLPAATAASTFSIVDRLGSLQWVLLKAAYRIPEAVRDSPCVVAIVTQIVDQGYALHGREVLPSFNMTSRAPGNARRSIGSVDP